MKKIKSKKIINSSTMNFWPTWRENKGFALLLGIVLVYSIVLLGAKINQTLKITNRLDEPTPVEHTIYVDGVGTATGTPDIAEISMGIESRGTDVATAQTSNTTSMNTLIEKIKALGIEEADIQTSNYSVYEDETWNPETGVYTSNGWIVSQQVTIKIRDTAKISSALETAGLGGATNIYGPSFTIDDPSNLKDEARSEALADAHSRALQIAASLGVELDGVVGYSEWTDEGSLYAERAYLSDMVGAGGSGPTISPGSSDITVHVSVTYKLSE